MHYDERGIERFAQNLYLRAQALEVGFPIVNAIVGLIVGALIGGPFGTSAARVAAGCAGAGALLGWMVSQGPVSVMRFQAQTVLCQLQIERNTRSTAFHAATLVASMAAAPVAAFGPLIRTPTGPGGHTPPS